MASQHQHKSHINQKLENGKATRYIEKKKEGKRRARWSRLSVTLCFRNLLEGGGYQAARECLKLLTQRVKLAYVHRRFALNREWWEDDKEEEAAIGFARASREEEEKKF